MLLTAFIFEGLPVTSRIKTEDVLIPFKWETTVSVGYQDVTTIQNINDFAPYAVPEINAGLGVSTQDIKDEYIATYLPSWATLTDAEKTILINFGVWPLTETLANLDTLVPAANRDIVIQEAAKAAASDGRDVKISPDGTQWETTVGDGGVITTSEIKPDGS